MVSPTRSSSGPASAVFRFLGGLIVAALCSAGVASAAEFALQTTLRGAAGNQGLGAGVALSGTRLAVANTDAAGDHVVVYQRGGSGWIRQGSFRTDLSEGRWARLRMSGDTIVAGTEIYVWNGSTWAKQFTIPVQPNDVAIDGNTVVAGVPGENATAYGTEGAVYVYTRSGTTWSQQARIASPAGNTAGLGDHVAIQGDTLIATGVGYPERNSGWVADAWVYQRSGATWTQQAQLGLPGASFNYGDGWSVSLDDGVAALGNPVRREVRLYQRNGSSWAPVGTAVPPAADTPSGAFDNFGTKLAWRGGTLAVMSTGGGDAGTVRSNVHFYAAGAGGWAQSQRLVKDVGVVTVAVDDAGAAVAIGMASSPDSAGSVEIYGTGGSTGTGSGTWQGSDVGSVGQAGTDSESGGTVTIRGAGADIWGTVDALHFRSQELSGDGSIVARLTTLESGNAWAKVGIMLRADSGAGAANVMALATPGGHTGVQIRTAAGQATSFTDATYGALPLWLMLDRQGNTVRAYRSIDGNNWTSLGSATLTLPATVRVGIAITSHDASRTIGATFDNVMIVGGDGASTETPPAAPGSVQVSDVTATTARVTWTDNSSNETAFVVERADGSASSGGEPAFHDVATVAANATSYADSGLAAATRYAYRVRAQGAGGDSTASAAYTVTTAGASSSTSGSWTGTDIGNVGVTGTQSAAGDAVTLNAGGADIWDTADSFRYYYRSWSGDGSITVRVAGLTNTNSWAKAGVMFRESLAPGAANAAMLLTSGVYCGLQTRATTGAATEFASGPWVNPAYWVRLTRTGNIFKGEISSDGATWTQVASKTVAMGANVYVGLAASSHNTSTQTVATFDHLALPEMTTQSPNNPSTGSWTATTWNATGSFATSNGTITASATGSDIWNAADAGRFDSQPWTGDGEVVVKVDALTAPNGWTKAGLMIRSDLSAGAANAFVALTGGVGAIFQGRPSAGGGTSQVQQNWSAGAGAWLKLTRAGNVLSAFLSTNNGSTWTALGTQTIALPASVYVGLAVSSHDASHAATATFSQFAVR